MAYDNEKYAPEYVLHEVFFRELHTFHAKIVTNISQIDFTNYMQRLQELRATISGYPSYFRPKTKEQIKNKIKEIEELILDKAFLDLCFQVGKYGISKLKQSEYKEFQEKTNEIIIEINETFELINLELPRFKMMPRAEVVSSNASEEEDDPEKKRELQALEEIGLI